MFQGDAYPGNDDYSLGSVTASPAPEADEEMVGMRGLWCAVILQAIQDAFGKTNCKQSFRAADQHLAIHWLTNKNPDFIDVCLMANMSPSLVRKEVKKLIEKGGYQFRAAAGTGKRYEERKQYRVRQREKRKMQVAPLRLIVSRKAPNQNGAAM